MTPTSGIFASVWPASFSNRPSSAPIHACGVDDVVSPINTSSDSAPIGADDDPCPAPFSLFQVQLLDVATLSGHRWSTSRERRRESRVRAGLALNARVFPEPHIGRMNGSLSSEDRGRRLVAQRRKVVLHPPRRYLHDRGVGIDIWLGSAFERDSSLAVATHKGEHLREAINLVDAPAVWAGNVGRFHLSDDSSSLFL
jgi:hypothetical protein